MRQPRHFADRPSRLLMRQPPPKAVALLPPGERRRSLGGEAERIRLGEFYEDCRYHPMVCIRPSPPGDDELLGVSLIDGLIGACSEDHCGVVPLTAEEALARKVWFHRVAERMGWPVPATRDLAADDLGLFPMPEEWRELYDKGPKGT